MIWCPFQPGDVFFAYLKRYGFVGVGKIRSAAKRIGRVQVKGRPLLSLPLTCKLMDSNVSDPYKSEYVCLVKWVKTVPREDAVWRSKPKLFTTTHVRASLDGQPKTVKFLEDRFGVEVLKLIK